MELLVTRLCSLAECAERWGIAEEGRGEVVAPPARVVSPPAVVLGLLEFKQTGVPIVLSGLHNVPS